MKKSNLPPEATAGIERMVSRVLAGQLEELSSLSGGWWVAAIAEEDLDSVAAEAAKWNWQPQNSAWALLVAEWGMFGNRALIESELLASEQAVLQGTNPNLMVCGMCRALLVQDFKKGRKFGRAATRAWPYYGREWILYLFGLGCGWTIIFVPAEIARMFWYRLRSQLFGLPRGAVID